MLNFLKSKQNRDVDFLWERSLDIYDGLKPINNKASIIIEISSLSIAVAGMYAAVHMPMKKIYDLSTKFCLQVNHKLNQEIGKPLFSNVDIIKIVGEKSAIYQDMFHKIHPHMVAGGDPLEAMQPIIDKILVDAGTDINILEKQNYYIQSIATKEAFDTCMKIFSRFSKK